MLQQMFFQLADVCLERVNSYKYLYLLMAQMVSTNGEIWGFKESQELELSFLKFILGLPPNATNAAVRGELGQLPLRKERILK